MAGQLVIHVWCACGRVATIPETDQMRRMTRDQLLPRFRCSAYGRRQATDMRRGWTVPDQASGPKA